MNEDLVTLVEEKTHIRAKQIAAVLSLLEEGATIPFIARYRKEVTGNLDEEQIRNIVVIYEYEEKLSTRKKEVLQAIANKDKLTDENTSNTVKVEYNNLSLEIVYDNTKNLEEERTRLEQELTRLTNSIERRKKLLSNENYTSKAPLNIVNKEKEDLSKELEQLEIIKNKLK